jgi:hypothetical protein
MQNTPKPTTETAVEQQHNAEAEGLQLGNIAELMAASSKLDKLKPAVQLSSTYVELEKVGDAFRGIYAGLTQITVNDKDTGEVREMAAARFIIDGKIRLNAGSVLISELKQVGVPVGTPLEVKYSRKEGRTKIYELTLLKA